MTLQISRVRQVCLTWIRCCTVLIHNFARLPSRKIIDCAQSPIFPYVRSSSTPTLTGDHVGFKCTRSSLAINLACGASAKRGEGDGEKKHFSTTLACFKRSDSEDGQSEQVKQRGGRAGVRSFPLSRSSTIFFIPFSLTSRRIPLSERLDPGTRPLGTCETKMAASYIERLNSTILWKNKRSRKGAISVQIQKDKVFEFLVYPHYLYFCNRQRNSWPHLHTKQNLMMKWALNWV